MFQLMGKEIYAILGAQTYPYLGPMTHEPACKIFYLKIHVILFLSSGNHFVLQSKYVKDIMGKCL